MFFQGTWWYRSIKYGNDQVLMDTTKIYLHFFAKTPCMPLKSRLNTSRKMCGVVWCGMVRCSVVCGMMWCVVRCGVWCGVVWCGGVVSNVIWFGVVRCCFYWFYCHSRLQIRFRFCWVAAHNETG